MRRPPSSRATVDDLPATSHPTGDDRLSADVALLAATALGFAYGPPEDDETQASRLRMLADCHTESLSRAQAAVLTLEVGSAPARMRAAELLRNAAQRVDDPCDAGLCAATVVATAAPLTSTVEDRR